VNPIPAKFSTEPDLDMPPALDFAILGNSTLAEYDDERMTLKSSFYIPGRFPATLAIGNGYVIFLVVSLLYCQLLSCCSSPEAYPRKDAQTDIRIVILVQQ